MSTKKTTRQALNEQDHMVIINRFKRDEGLRERVMKWLCENEYHKVFKRCKQCDEVSKSAEFHGRQCRSCTREYRKKNYAENCSKQHTERKRSVTFRKDTKKT